MHEDRGRCRKIRAMIHPKQPSVHWIMTNEVNELISEVAVLSVECEMEILSNPPRPTAQIPSPREN